jgi:hypothetical protein
MVCDYRDAPSYDRAYANWVGVATILQNNLYFYGATTCIIQMPLWVPVLRRELMNRMYSPSMYYWARVTSGIIFQFIYPLLVSFCLFWTLGITISVQNFFFFMINACGIVTCGCAVGFLFGVSFNNDQLALTFMTFFLQYTYLLGGGFSNNKTRDIVNQYLMYASPCRYGAENYFRIFADGNIPPDDTLERALNFYGFNLGYEICFPA